MELSTDLSMDLSMDLVGIGWRVSCFQTLISSDSLWSFPVSVHFCVRDWRSRLAMVTRAGWILVGIGISKHIRAKSLYRTGSFDGEFSWRTTGTSETDPVDEATESLRACARSREVIAFALPLTVLQNSQGGSFSGLIWDLIRQLAFFRAFGIQWGGAGMLGLKQLAVSWIFPPYVGKSSVNRGLGYLS
jgi:hypothetical protein